MRKRMALKNIRLKFTSCAAQFYMLRPSRAALGNNQIFEFLIGSKLLREAH